MKKGKLSKVEKGYIEYKKTAGFTADQIAPDMDRSVEVVQSYYDSVAAAPVEPAPVPPPRNPGRDHLDRMVAVTEGGTRIGAVMREDMAGFQTTTQKSSRLKDAFQPIYKD